MGAAALSLLMAVPASAATSTPSPTPSPSGVVPSAGSTGQPKVTFGIGTATKGRLDQRQEIQIVQARGTTATDEVVVVNEAYVPLTLNVYSVDVYNDVNGNLQPAVAATKPVDVGLWTTLHAPGGKRTIVVPAKGRVFIPVTVTIPKNAYIGDHLGGIIVSLIAKGQGSDGKSANVNLEQRVGIRLGVRVAGPLKPELTVTDLSASYTGTLNPFGRGTAQVTFTVKNSGNVKLGGHEELNIGDLFGSAAPMVAVPDLPVLLPGGAGTFTVQVPDVTPLVMLHADVSVTPMGAKGDANPSFIVATGSTVFWAIPWTLLAVVLGLLLLIGWWVRRRRRAPTPAGGRRERGGSPSSSDLVSAGSVTSGETS